MSYFWIVVEALGAIPWVAVVTAVISLGFLWTAWQVLHTSKIALTTWQRELRSRRELQFWDDLNTAVHDFIIKMNPAMSTFRFVKICLDSYADTWDKSKGEGLAWFVHYLERDKGRNRVMLISDLQEAMQAKTALDSIASMGQVYHIPNYPRCRNACINLSQVYTRLEAIAYAIRDTSTNFDNPEVIRVYNNLLAVTLEELQEQLDSHFVIIMEFMQECYSALLDIRYHTPS